MKFLERLSMKEQQELVLQWTVEIFHAPAKYKRLRQMFFFLLQAMVHVGALARSVSKTYQSKSLQIFSSQVDKRWYFNIECFTIDIDKDKEGKLYKIKELHICTITVTTTDDQLWTTGGVALEFLAQNQADNWSMSSDGWYRGGKGER